MKKIVCSLLAIFLATFVFAQSSTTSEPDIFGNVITIHKDAYGRVIGTSITGQPDILGYTTTIHKDADGR